jgi:hypothetical protein
LFRESGFSRQSSSFEKIDHFFVGEKEVKFCGEKQVKKSRVKKVK